MINFSFFFAIFFLLNPGAIFAKKITIFFRPDIKLYQIWACNIKNEFQDNVTLIPVSTRDKKSISIEKSDLIISFGDRAAQEISNFPNKKAIFLVSNPRFCKKANYCLTLFPDLNIILSQTKKIFPNFPIKLVVTQRTKDWVQIYQVKSRSNLEIEEVDTGEIREYLRKIFKKRSVIILLPDPIFLQEKILREIVRLSFITKIPVVGFSKKMVNYGILMSINYKYEDFLPYIIKTIKYNFNKPKVDISFPYYIVINKKVLNFLNIELPNSKNIVYVD